MRDAAANLEFEEAARLRDEIKRLEDGELGLPTRGGPVKAADPKPWRPNATRSREAQACGVEEAPQGLSRQASRPGNRRGS